MAVQPKWRDAPASEWLPMDEEVGHLLEMFEFFLVERSLGKPIKILSEAIADLRIIIGRLITDHFLDLPSIREADFCATLADLLSERAERIPLASEAEAEYIAYCIGEILTSFEWAQEVKIQFSYDPVMRRILAVDIPVLRPFDYGIRNRLRLVS